MTTVLEPTTTLVDVTDLASDVTLLEEAREQLKFWAELEAGAKKRLADRIGEGVGTVDGAPVVTVTGHSRTGFSTTAFRTVHPALYAEFATSTSYRTVKVLDR